MGKNKGSGQLYQNARDPGYRGRDYDALL